MSQKIYSLGQLSIQSPLQLWCMLIVWIFVIMHGQLAVKKMRSSIDSCLHVPCMQVHKGQDAKRSILIWILVYTCNSNAKAWVNMGTPKDRIHYIRSGGRWNPLESGSDSLLDQVWWADWFGCDVGSCQAIHEYLAHYCIISWLSLLKYHLKLRSSPLQWTQAASLWKGDPFIIFLKQAIIIH